MSEPTAAPVIEPDTQAPRASVPGAFHRNSNLTLELALTAFKLKYAGSALGYLWSLMKPLMIFGMMYLVFAVFLVGKRAPASENFPVELLLAVIVWTFFADATMQAIVSIATNGHMIRKAYFPRWILVLASTLSAAMTLAINLCLILAIGLPLGWFHLTIGVIALPFLFVELYILVLGIGLLLSALFVFYRDISHVWEIMMQLLFYASCIVFPFSIVPKRWQPWAALNPMAQLIEDMRRAVVTTQIRWTAQILGWWVFVPLLGVAFVFGLGVFVFRKLTPRFGEAL